jgi:PAS domain S-box-containing protein
MEFAWGYNLEQQESQGSRQVSCRVINSVIQYMESQGYDADRLTTGLPFSLKYLRDPLNWVPFSVREILARRAADLSGDASIMYRVGLNIPKLNSIGGIQKMVLRLGGPKFVYKSIPRFASFFDKLDQFSVVIEGENKAMVTMSSPKEYGVYKSACYFARGILAGIPTLWDVPPARVIEQQCQCDSCNSNGPGDIRYGAESCLYEVTWQLRGVNPHKKGNIFSFGGFAGRSIKEIEDNFVLLDKKNYELQLRNTQLSKVREVAIEIDGLRTKEKIFERILELARDIPGVLFVTLLSWQDVEKKNVIAPYFSKLRSKSIKAGLKAANIDLSAMLGDKPDSRKFRYLSEEAEFQKKYIADPKTTNVDSLAELLDGIWPGVFCNTIQKIAGIRSTTIVPIIIDKELWGSLVFFLNDSVPNDILEMVASHCSSALNIAGSFNLLQKRNDELTALNNITNLTVSSFDLETILDNVIRETVQTLSAESGAIYLLDETSDCLELFASVGMPPVMRNSGGSISLKNSLIGEFFTSDLSVMTGNLKDYTDRYPVYAMLLSSENATYPFITAVIKIKKGRCGVMSVIRKIDNFGEGELTLLKSISNQLSVAIDNSRLHGDLMVRIAEVEQVNHRLEYAMKSQAESEAKYRLIAENTIDYISMLSLDYLFLYASPSYGQLGYDEGFLLGKSAMDLIHPEDKIKFIPLITRYSSMKVRQMTGLDSQNISEVIEFRMIDREGKWHDIEATISVIDETEGNRVGILIVGRDVTERRRVEMAVREQRGLVDATMDSTASMLLVVGENHEILLVNNSFCSSFDVEKQRVLGSSIDTIFPVPDLIEGIDKVLQHSISSFSTEFMMKIGTGSRILDARVTSMRQNDVLIVISDITDELERQQRLYLTDRLVSIGEMASGVAHELNNPLTSILMLSQMLAGKEMAADDREDLDIIRKEAERAAAIVRNLLTFARKNDQKRVPVDICDLIKDVLKLRVYEHKLNNIEVDTQFESNIPPLLMDYHQMQQVFLNLIQNAEQAMIESGCKPLLTISVRYRDGNVITEVTDSGAGISEENMKKLFTPFFTTKKDNKGTGLGLSISYGIVSRHGGKIYARSKAGCGATFIVELAVCS